MFSVPHLASAHARESFFLLSVMALSGLVLLPALAIGEDEYVETRTDADWYQADGLFVKFEGTVQPSPIGTWIEEAPFLVRSTTRGRASTARQPSLGLGNAPDNFRVRLYPGGSKDDARHGGPTYDGYLADEFRMIAIFSKGTKHGGFDIRDEREEVTIRADASHSTGWYEVMIERRPGWPHPCVNFGGNGVIRSGNVSVTINGRDVQVKEDNVVNINYSYAGATPLMVFILGWPYEYTFTRDGRVLVKKRQLDSDDPQRN